MKRSASEPGLTCSSACTHDAIDSFRDTLFTLLAKGNRFFTHSCRKDAASSGFALVNTSVNLMGLKAG